MRVEAECGRVRASAGEWWEGVCVILGFCIKRGVCVGQGSVDPRLPAGSDLTFRLRFQTLGRVCSLFGRLDMVSALWLTGHDLLRRVQAWLLSLARRIGDSIRKIEKRRAEPGRHN